MMIYLCIFVLLVGFVEGSWKREDEAGKIKEKKKEIYILYSYWNDGFIFRHKTTVDIRKYGRLDDYRLNQI
jgi:hypothetical protein